MAKVEEIIINEMSEETARKICHLLETKDYSELETMSNEELDILIRLLNEALSGKEEEASA